MLIFISMGSDECPSRTDSFVLIQRKKNQRFEMNGLIKLEAVPCHPSISEVNHRAIHVR